MLRSPPPPTPLSVCSRSAVWCGTGWSRDHHKTPNYTSSIDLCICHCSAWNAN